MAFVKDGWYCAGWTAELKDKPSSIVICGEEIVLYRDTAGKPIAMENRCPHRFAPLSMGQVVGDRIQCPYHGLEFNSRGECAFNPHGRQTIPSRAPQKTYVLEERNGVIWIWMGDSAKADPSKILALDYLDDDRYAIVRGHFKVKANYKLLNDNLLDLTHAAYIHPTTVGTSTDAGIRVKYSVRTEGNRILSQRLISEVRPTAQFLGLFKEPTGDFYSHLTWTAPSSMFLDLSMVPHGTPKRSVKEPDVDCVLIPGAHLIVPETEHTTHYFFAVSRSADIHNQEKTQAMIALSHKAFMEEDAPIIEECYRLMEGKEFLELKPAILESDRGSVLARRIVSRLLAAESPDAGTEARLGDGVIAE